MPAKKSRTSSSAKALSSDSIGMLCVTLAKPAAGAAPTRSDGLSARFSSGKARLDRRVAPAQLVVFGVGDLRRVVGVIEPVVMRDLGGEPRQLGARLVLGQRLDRPRVIGRSFTGMSFTAAPRRSGWRRRRAPRR